MDQLLRLAIVGVVIGLLIGALLNMQRALMRHQNSPNANLITHLPFNIQTK